MTDRQILLGRILGPHGLKGEVKIKSFTAVPLDVASYGLVTVPDGRRFKLANARMQGDAVVAAIQGITGRTAAEALKGLELKVEREDLPETTTGEYYQTDLVGLPVFNDEGTELGEVKGFQHFGAGDLVEIALPSGRSSFVPFANSMVPIVDIDEGRLVLSATGVAVLAAGDEQQSCEGPP